MLEFALVLLVHITLSPTRMHLCVLTYLLPFVGKGCVFSFDPVGSYEREQYRAGGTAAAMLQPLLDNQIGFKNQTGAIQEPLTIEKAVALVTDVFVSATERDIYTGDGISIKIITASGVEVREVPLRRD